MVNLILNLKTKQHEVKSIANNQLLISCKFSEVTGVNLKAVQALTFKTFAFYVVRLVLMKPTEHL